VEFIAARFARGAFLVTYALRLGRARRGHAAAVTPCAVQRDNTGGEGLAEDRRTTDRDAHTPLHPS
jgi:hypothetical protein